MLVYLQIQVLFLIFHINHLNLHYTNKMVFFMFSLQIIHLLNFHKIIYYHLLQ